jgi:hypothetical protein
MVIQTSCSGQVLWNTYWFQGYIKFTRLETRGLPFLDGSNKVRQVFFMFGTFPIRDGSQVRLGGYLVGKCFVDHPYLGLKNIARHKFVIIKEVLGTRPQTLSFRSDLIRYCFLAVNGNGLLEFRNEVMSPRHNVFRWNLQKKIFSAKSMYRA